MKEKGDPLHLGVGQLRAVRRLVTSAKASPRERVRGLCVLLTAAGHSGQEIGELLGVTRRTVTQSRTRFRKQGLSGLREAPHPGRPPRADPAYLKRLFDLAVSDPRRQGYVFVRWTAGRLAAHLALETGIELSAERVAALLRAHRLVWRRTKRTIRNLADPEQIERERQRLAQLKKTSKRKTPTTSSGSPMESGSICSPS